MTGGFNYRDTGCQKVLDIFGSHMIDVFRMAGNGDQQVALEEVSLSKWVFLRTSTAL